MKLSLFGEAARTLRMRYDAKLKHMADHMKISSSHLSGIEYGEKSLSDAHVELAIGFFRLQGATEEELRALQRAAAKTKTDVQVGGLSHSDRHLVAVFARQLAAGRRPDGHVFEFLDTVDTGDI